MQITHRWYQGDVLTVLTPLGQLFVEFLLGLYNNHDTGSFWVGLGKAVFRCRISTFFDFAHIGLQRRKR